jgi:hypothetical protein
MASVMRRAAILIMTVCGCGGGARSLPPDIIPNWAAAKPHRFYVASLTLPSLTQDFAVDLDGDGKPDDKLAGVLDELIGTNDNNTFVDEIVAARAINAMVDIYSTDPQLGEDANAGVRWIGDAGAIGNFVSIGDLAGGALHGGALSTNEVRYTQHPVGGWLALPLFSSADPTEMWLQSWQMELSRQDDGSFTAQLQGVVRTADLGPAAYVGFLQLLRGDGEPDLQAFDLDHDGTVSLSEFETGFQGFFAPDVHSTPPGLSVAIAMRLLPCQDGNCTRPLPAPTCQDRVKNGDEVGVDCGGSVCGPCR